MIFDLKSGKRRRVVQVVFGFLAFIFFISFVGFGIGSNSVGGLFDAIGIGGGSNSTSDPQFSQQISDAEATLQKDPQNTAALIALVRYHFLEANQGITNDPQTGAPVVGADAQTQLEQAADAWDRYLKTKPDHPNVEAASNAVRAFVLLNDAKGAASAQEIVAADQNSSIAYGQLAFYYYAGADLKNGDAAAKKAVDLSDPATQKQTQQQMDAYRKQSVQLQQQIQQQAQQGGAQQGGAQLENPFGGLGASSGTGAAPAAPTP
jgi:hypothetical protein